MASNRVLLDTSAFLDTVRSSGVKGVAIDEVESITRDFLECCYEDLAKAPRHLDGEDVCLLLREMLPRHFGVADPRAASVEAVLGAYLQYLEETCVVPGRYEFRRALDENLSAFRDSVAKGEAHQEGVAAMGSGETVRHRVEKTGRNDPCPCGSGKKFKKCCMRL